MDHRISSDSEQIDHKTCVAICRAIGEQLQQSIVPETELWPRLRDLLNRLRRQDSDT